MGVPLLRAKLTVPAVPSPHVERTALLDHLESGRRRGRKLSLLVAPAGYGKSTLVAAWIAHSGLPAGWLTLDERDNLPARFLRYFIAALAALSLGLEARLEALLRAALLPPLESLIERIVAEIEALGEEAAPPARERDASGSSEAPSRAAFLVLDDLHALSEPAISQVLELFLDYLPPSLHLVLLSREEPPLRIRRLRARGSVTEIGPTELRFSRAETERFFRDAAVGGVPPDALDAVQRSTEGWVTALRFAALAAQGGSLGTLVIPRLDAVRETSSDRLPGKRQILAFLFEEVLAGRPPEVREFLVLSSIFERLSAELCEAVLAEAAAPTAGAAGPPLSPSELLSRVVRGGLFVSPVGEAGDWFRYHPLFRELLLARLAERGAEPARSLHLRAAQWFRARGFLEEALGHLFRAGAIDEAARLLEEEAKSAAIWDGLSVQTFLASLNRIPDLERRPWLSLYAARVGYLGGRPEESVLRLERLLKLLAEDRSLPPEERRLLEVHNTYGVVEGYCLRIAKFLENDPDPLSWHRELIGRMTLDIRGVRPALFQRGETEPLEELRAFRHVFRNLYARRLDPSKVAGVQRQVAPALSILRRSHGPFCEALRKIGSGA